MEVDLWLNLAAVILLLALSAYFSSSESAFFSLSRNTLDKLRESTDPRARRVAHLMDNPRLLLAAILSGNTVVNTAAAALAAFAAVDLAHIFDFNTSLAIAIEVACMSIIILFFSELFPKFIALKDSEKYAMRVSLALLIISRALYPIAGPLSWLTGRLSVAMGVEGHSAITMSESEIRALVQVGHERGALEADERRMIHSIFQFGDTTVREIMVPRIDIVAVDVTIPLDEMLELVVDCGHSRIPVYENTIDNVIGLIYAKDLLAVTRGLVDFNLRRLIRTNIMFVPEEKKIDDLLREFQSQKMHMSLVVDEYGGIAGLVTMEDIIEEIVGEIQDEYDKEQPLVKRVDEKTLIVNGRLNIYEFNELEGFEIVPDSEAYDTIAGFVYSKLGVVPKKGQQFEYKGFSFIVDEVLNKRIIRIKIVKDGGVFEDV